MTRNETNGNTRNINGIQEVSGSIPLISTNFGRMKKSCKLNGLRDFLFPNVGKNQRKKVGAKNQKPGQKPGRGYFFCPK